MFFPHSFSLNNIEGIVLGVVFLINDKLIDQHKVHGKEREMLVFIFMISISTLLKLLSLQKLPQVFWVYTSTSFAHLDFEIVQGCPVGKRLFVAVTRFLKPWTSLCPCNYLSSSPHQRSLSLLLSPQFTMLMVCLRRYALLVSCNMQHFTLSTLFSFDSCFPQAMQCPLHGLQQTWIGITCQVQLIGFRCRESPGLIVSHFI